MPFPWYRNLLKCVSYIFSAGWNFPLWTFLAKINTHKTFEYFGLSLEEMMRPQNIPTYTRITSTGFVNNFKYITHIFDPSLKVKLRPEAGSVAYRTGYCNIRRCTNLTCQIYTQIRYVHTTGRCTHKIYAYVRKITKSHKQTTVTHTWEHFPLLGSGPDFDIFHKAEILMT